MPLLRERLSYPQTKKIDHTDTYHGTDVQDPYRWLEQASETPEVSDWIQAQNTLSFQYLKSIPEREKLLKRLTELWNYPKSSAPFKKGNKYFQFRNTGLQNQSTLFVSDSLELKGKVLLDPNTLSSDGTAALSTLTVSPNGQYLAYAVSYSGSDWQTWFVREIETGQDLQDRLEWSKFSTATWLPDSSGFTYARYPEPEQNNTFIQTTEASQLMLHKLGTTQTEDSLVYTNSDDLKQRASLFMSDDDAYQILHIVRGTKPENLIYYRPNNEKTEFKPLIDRWEASYIFLGNDANIFYFKTTKQADRARIIAIDITQPREENWLELISESKDTLQAVQLIQKQFICLYLKDAHSQLKRFDLQGKPLADIELPALGSVTTLNAERGDDALFYGFTSFLYPTSNFCFDLKTETTKQLDHPDIDFNQTEYETRQVFVVSKDGTRIPMFITSKKGLELNGQNPALLTGYGGFNVSRTPSFSTSYAVWLELGGVLALANLRGGGEYGKAWHEAGTLHQKQNVFDDFIACAEHLINSNISSTKKLAIQGGSNGGLLVGAAITQRPDLFGAALPAVGVMDMLRYHKFTIGWAWVSDYGSADDPELFPTLLDYSPLHNLKDGISYPATLVTTGDHDDRVVPAHSFKFAARLQEANKGDNPMLIRIQTDAGHGAGKPTTMLISEQADIWAFLVKTLSVAV